MVCKNCGINVKNNLKYCNKCGANIVTGIVPTAHPIGVTAEKQKKDNIIKIIKIGSIVIVIIIIAIVVYFLVK